MGVEFVQGNRLVAMTAAGSVWLADGPSSEPRRIGGHDFGGLAFAVQLGGRLAATGGQDGRVRIWDVIDGRDVMTIPTDAARVDRVAWSHDGQRIATASGTGVVLWDASGRGPRVDHRRRSAHRRRP